MGGDLYYIDVLYMTYLVLKLTGVGGLFTFCSSGVFLFFRQGGICPLIPIYFIMKLEIHLYFETDFWRYLSFISLNWAPGKLGWPVSQFSQTFQGLFASWEFIGYS